MFLTTLTRNDLLNLLPLGGEIAEIGVAKGDFSQHILNIVKPRRLHLIDPWIHHHDGNYTVDGNNVDTTEQEQRYESVLVRFSEQIGCGQVIIHRRFSEEAAKNFSDGQFDWIYIDGDHSAHGVYADLEAYYPKLKRNGFILGHDYTNHIRAQHYQFGVVEAVNRFCRARGVTLMAMTWEGWPTYILVAEPEGAAAKALLTRMFETTRPLVELRDYPDKGEFLHRMYCIGDAIYAVPSF